MKNSQYIRQAQYRKGFIVPLLAAIALLVIGGGVYFYSQKKSASMVLPTNKVPSNTKDSTAFNDSDLRISYISISNSNNSAPAFNAVKANSITKSDLDFLSKYVTNYSPTNLPPVAQSQKILSTYPDLLNIFDANANKKYQCSVLIEDTCRFQSIRDISNLAGLRALVSFQQNKSNQAETTAYNLIALGKNVTANADEVIPLLIGWPVQKLGYSILSTIRPKENTALFTDSEKGILITQLRQEHKNVLRYAYTRAAEGIDYITYPNKKPSIILTPDDEDMVATYRKGVAASPTAWNPNETKKYFYDSYKIALLNIDLACGATPATSKMELNFNPRNQQTENYVGKTMYTTTYASLDTLSQKRCAIENLIQNL